MYYCTFKKTDVYSPGDDVLPIVFERNHLSQMLSDKPDARLLIYEVTLLMACNPRPKITKLPTIQTFVKETITNKCELYRTLYGSTLIMPNLSWRY